MRADTKNQIRNDMRQMRDGCPPALRKEWSKQIAARVLAMPELKSTEQFFLYASFRSEVDTDFLLQTFLNEKKTVAFPRVETCREGDPVTFPHAEPCREGDPVTFPHAEPCREGNRKKTMEFYRVKSYSELAKGYQNIAEPVTKIKAEPKNTVIFLPGLAFDRSGNRLGYGAGFYDRYLSEHKTYQPLTIALAFDFQLLDALPAEKTDVRTDFIVTEKQIYATG